MRPSGCVSLLFSDIEGSTRLWEAHPNAMRVGLQQHDAQLRAAIETSGGYVFKTVGDSFCAAFASPRAALQAAVEAQRRIAGEDWPDPLRLSVRIGIHTGLCDERDGDYFGPTVNRAARLEAIAHGGQVVLSEATVALVGDTLPDGIAVRDLGWHRLKGLAEPEHVFQLDVADLPRDFPPLRSLAQPAEEAGLLARDAELSQARERIAEVTSGQGGLLLVEGVAGIGKTRLLREVSRAATDAGLDVLAARAGELEQRFAFSLIRQAVETALERIDADRREELLGGVVRPARPAITGDLGQERELPESHGVLNGLFWLLVRLASDRGLVLVLDDLHWSDEGTLRLLSFAVRRLESVPLLIVAATRPSAESGFAGLAAEAGVSVLRPGELDEASVGSLIRQTLEQEPEQQFARACLAATGGNPFLVVELLRTLRNDEVEPIARNADRLAAITPESVSRSVSARLARLGPDATALARAVAVLGERPRLSLAADLAHLDQAEASRAADALAEAGLIAHELPLGFSHPLLRTAVAAALAPGERQRLHATAARLLGDGGASAERVALHLLETEPRGDAAVARVLAQAGTSALSRGSPATAVALFRRVLEEPPAPEDRLQVTYDLGIAESGTGEAEATEHLRSVLDTATDAFLRARALRQLTWVTLPSSDEQRALMPVYEDVAREVEPLDRELALSLHAARISALFLNPGSEPRFEDEIERFRNLPGETPAECALLAWLARKTMTTGGTAAETAQIADRAAGNASTTDVGPGPVWLLHLILALIAVERFETAERLLQPEFDAARARGSASAFASASTQRALVRLAAGDLRGSEADARAALEAHGLENYYPFQPLIPLTEALGEQGRSDEAESLLADRGLHGELPPARPYTALLIARGRMRSLAGNMAEALTDLEEALARLERARAHGVMGLDGRIEAAFVLHVSGDAERASLISDEALAAARAWGGNRALGGSLRVAGLLTGGSEGVELLREAVSTLAGSPARLWYAHSLVDLGAALRRANQRRECREPLREGIAVAEECGAAPLVERARRELAASGGRVPERTGGRFDELTPSERRVAEHAARGLSNPEIAQRLFVTLKTVEMHLSNAYRKLDIKSRHELPQALAD